MANSYRYLHTPLLVARWNDFSGGEYGLVGPRHAGHNQFTGRNVVPYRDGSIGPRSGGISLHLNPAPDSNGILECGWTMPSTRARFIGQSNDYGRIWMVNADGKHIKYADVDTSTSILTGAANLNANDYTGSPLGSAVVPAGHTNTTVDHHRVITGGAGLWTIFDDLGTVSAVAGSPNGTCVCVYGDRAVIGGVVSPVTSKQNRIRFSAANDAGTWPSVNFVDFNGESMLALVPQRDHLLVIMSDLTHYIVTGTLGVNEVVRAGAQWSDGVFPYGYNTAGDDGRRVSRTNGGDAWGVTFDIPYPLHYNGITAQSVDTLPLAQVDPTAVADRFFMVPLGTPGDFVLIGGSSIVGTTTPKPVCAAAYIRGAWSLHELGAIRDDSGARTLLSCAAPGPGGSVIFSSSNKPRLYMWAPINLQPPGLANVQGRLSAGFFPESDWVGDTFNSGGAQAAFYNSYFTTAGAFDSRGYEWTARHVDVRFTSYSRGNTTVSGFNLSVNALDLKGGVLTTSAVGQLGASRSWDETHTAAAGTTYERRIVFDLPEIRGGGFSVTFDTITGVKINDVLVLAALPEDIRSV